jgi:hypothetical protein
LELRWLEELKLRWLEEEPVEWRLDLSLLEARLLLLEGLFLEIEWGSDVFV